MYADKAPPHTLTTTCSYLFAWVRVASGQDFFYCVLVCLHFAVSEPRLQERNLWLVTHVPKFGHYELSLLIDKLIQTQQSQFSSAQTVHRFQIYVANPQQNNRLTLQIDLQSDEFVCLQKELENIHLTYNFKQATKRSMFTEFLHPDAVLFGQPINPTIRCKHPFLLKDGEIIIHQQIMRPYIPNPTQSSTLRMRQRKEEKAEPQDNASEDEKDKMKRYYKAQSLQDYEEESSEEQAFGDQIVNYQHNPFADQLYSVAVDAQYIPQQWNQIIAGENNMHRKQSNKIPFSSKSQEQLDEVQNHWLEGQDDDTSWLTEQQVQQYLINEQLQEVSGSFATDAAA